MEEIEREIKENIMKYEIKTTSNDILNKMKKKKFSFKLPIIISTSFALACSVLLVVLIPSIVNSKPLFIENTSNKLNDRSLLSSLSLQMNIGEIFNNNSSSNIRKAKNDITNDDFIYCVDKIENIIPIYEDFLTNKDGIKYIFKEEKFSYQNNAYKYQLITDNSVLYLNNDLTNNKNKIKENILLLLDNQYYFGEIEFKYEQEEIETEIIYYNNEYKYVIQKDYEQEEYGIEYGAYLNDERIYKYSIELEYEEDELEFSYSKKTNDDKLEIEILSYDNNKEINFEEKTKTKELTIENIRFEKDNEKRIYIYNDKKIEKI